MNKSFVREHTEQLRRLTMGALSVAGCKIHGSTAVSFDLSEAESQEVMTGKRNLKRILGTVTISNFLDQWFLCLSYHQSPRNRIVRIQTP